MVIAWWADVTFLGPGPLENKPGVEGKKYDGSDINPEDRSKEIQGSKIDYWKNFACLQWRFIGSDHPFQELGKTEWEVQWWRDMKSQQEALSKKAAIETERAGHWAYHCNVVFSFYWNSAFHFLFFFWLSQHKKGADSGNVLATS